MSTLSFYSKSKQDELLLAKLDASLKGAINGVAELGSDGKVPTSQLPSYVSDIVEVENYAALPAVGEANKIYITKDDNKTYRWSGTQYVEISASLALGETSSTAHRGDHGVIAYNHSQIAGGTGVHISDAERTAWNGKYEKPADGIPKSDLEIGVKDSLNLADSSVQAADVSTGDNNGTIKVKSSNVAVKGLKSAAYTESTDYATAAQGAKADTAYQKPTSGIASTDLDSAVQASLGKADAALPKSKVTIDSTTGVITIDLD